jgi:hypothetical protein
MAGSWSFRAIARAVAPGVDMDVTLDPAPDAPVGRTAQSVYALMEKPGQRPAVRQPAAKRCKPTGSGRRWCCGACWRCWRGLWGSEAFSVL